MSLLEAQDEGGFSLFQHKFILNEIFRTPSFSVPQGPRLHFESGRAMV